LEDYEARLVAAVKDLATPNPVLFALSPLMVREGGKREGGRDLVRREGGRKGGRSRLRVVLSLL
jgi:hypothetical protein